MWINIPSISNIENYNNDKLENLENILELQLNELNDFFQNVNYEYSRFLDLYADKYKFYGCKCPNLMCREWIDEEYKDNYRCPECNTKIILSIPLTINITLDTKDEDIYVIFERN